MKLIAILLAAAALACAAEVKLGAPLTLKEATPIATLLANPGAYEGKVVQVKGKVTAVCQEMGCWMAVVDPESNKTIRIKVEDGVIVFPKDAPGKRATAEGKFTKLETAKGKPAAYQLDGLGAVLVD